MGRYVIVNKSNVIVEPGTDTEPSRYPAWFKGRPLRRVRSREEGRKAKKLFKNPREYNIIDTVMREVTR